MSVFKRAEWKSGLTYRQTCKECKNVVTYTDDILDFRPWYPDGFVYCPRCNTPLRHRENFAIDAPTVNEPIAATAAPVAAAPVTVEPATESADLPVFCAQCGNKFRETDRFCPKCGAKR